MPRIFDNIDALLINALKETLESCFRADFCVGYFNLRGWRKLDSCIEKWSGGEDHCCRLLVGMTQLPEDEVKQILSLQKSNVEMDNQTAIRLKKKLAEEFRKQLTIGAPTNEDEAGLRRLASQIKEKKVVVKLFLRHHLHAKLYLLFRPDPVSPKVGYLGSSNLTIAGLSQQGELNIDVLDSDACNKLADWFDDRWEDKWCIDISKELVEIIEESWARIESPPPYFIYLKMAYHLCQEARTGISEFRIPKDLEKKLREFQIPAVKIAAHHINKRGGVLIGDVVGMGKTLMATAVAKIFDEDFSFDTLIICPKNLVKMWDGYKDKYRLHGKILSISQVQHELPLLKRFRLLIIDESHNLRNREGKRYRAIQEYIKENESKVILLSATPYNKSYLDLSNQLRLIIPEDKDLGIRPEQLLKQITETEFIRRHQCLVRSLSAFEKSNSPDDWRELMRLYMVRRTRSFIINNYAETDPDNGRKFISLDDGKRSYFPERLPKTIKFKIQENNPDDQYAQLYSQDIVHIISDLYLPRYGLGNYIVPSPSNPPTQDEAKLMQNLSRAGKRLMGFCRTNLFKRLESCGYAFIQSVERHILRNYIYLYAVENNLKIPIGTQDIGSLDTRITDADEETDTSLDFFDAEEENDENENIVPIPMTSELDFKKRAAEIYSKYESSFKRRFKWLRSDLFASELRAHLETDVQSLLKILQKCGDWDVNRDNKLKELKKLITKKHPEEKVLIFTQFADTVNYLEFNLKVFQIPKLSGVTGASPDPTAIAWKFSPESNEKREQITTEEELRVVIATDVLSEGQNLQDCAVVVNYDLPWAIIRLIQRAGRVDRIGQKSEQILCYSFLPAEGVERIIRLRARVRQRLQENAEVVGSDEAFFEDDKNNQAVIDLYNEKAGILDGDDDTEVDLSSFAYQIWNNATKADPKLEKTIRDLPSVIFSTKTHQIKENEPEGALVYIRTGEGNDTLAWVDKNGQSITESQLAVLKAAECSPDTPAAPRHNKHHEMVKKAVEHIIEEEKSVGGQLGRPSGARFRTYERLKNYADQNKGTIFLTSELLRAIQDIYRHPLKESAVDTLNRQLRSGISDEKLVTLVTELHSANRLCRILEEEPAAEPQIICSLGLSAGKEE